MPSVPEPRPTFTAIIVRALIYALAVAALVVWLPGPGHVFIYQGF